MTLVPSQVLVKFINITISSQNIEIDIDKLIDNYNIPENEYLFKYNGNDQQMNGNRYTLSEIKQILEQNRNRLFYHYLPFNYIKKMVKLLTLKIGTRKKINKDIYLKQVLNFMTII